MKNQSTGIQLQLATVPELNGDAIMSSDIRTIYSTVDYYLRTTKKVQPFLGAGIGSAAEIDYSNKNNPTLITNTLVAQ